MIDASDFDEVIHDLSRAGPVVASKVRPIVSKGALNIKNQMRREALESTHFKQIAQSIDYDLKTHQFAGDGVIEAEIGPNPETDPAASLAGIAYFGSSKPGGGTVSDPVHALNDEATRFVQNLAEAAGFIFK